MTMEGRLANLTGFEEVPDDRRHPADEPSAFERECCHRLFRRTHLLPESGTLEICRWFHFFPEGVNFMARKKAAPTQSKSAAIRDYRASHATAKPKEIAEALNGSGYEVTPQYVSMILSNDRKKTGPSKKRGRPAGTKTKSSTSGQQVSMEDLLSAKQLISATGGLEQAKAALDAYQKLVSSN
jgi:predicted nucleic acid binding AN1-type Zn finger protein